MNEPLGSTAEAWIGLSVAIAVLLAIDLWVLRGRGGVMTTRAAAITSLAWLAISFAFAGILWGFGSDGQAEAYLAGYLVEKSLSLDNVFVFLVVFSAFAIPEVARARLLTYGIVLALVLRLIFILVGAAALEEASWLTYPFGLLLLWTGWKLWKSRHGHGSEEALVAGLKRRITIADGAPGQLVVREHGQRILTASGAALIAIAIVDIIFAVDSIPAILAITTDTFVVFTANAFALLGLRPLFFLVADLVERLYYLKAALALLLIFIAVKMGLAETVGKLPPEYSLTAVVVVLGGGVIASLIRDRRRRGVATG